MIALAEGDCDECGTLGPWRHAVYVKRSGASREYAVRNLPHDAAHRMADRERAGGHRAHISIDSCG